MLTSKMGRRLALKTSALGLMGTLVLFAGSLLAGPAPAAAEADIASLAATKQFNYTCQTGGPVTNTAPISIGFSAPDSVAAGSTLDLTVNIPPLTLGTGVVTVATTLQVDAALTNTPSTVTVSDPGAKAGPQLAQGAPSTTAGTVTYKLMVPAGTTSKVSVRPGDIKLSLANAPTSVTTCTNSSPATDVLDVPIGTGGGTGTDIISYECTLSTTGGTDADYPATVDIKVTPTMPTSASANQDASITWTGAVQSTGDELKVPAAGFPASSKIFATVKASGAGAPATATGEAALTSTAGQSLTTLPSVTIKVKPTTTGTVTITPGDLAFGTSATAPTVKCTAPTTGLKTYTFTVSAATSTPTTSNTPTPTKTTTEFVTETPTTRKSPTTRSSKTPKKGAATGAGGDAGPDGRMFLLAGSVLIMGAGAGGLLLRRRIVSKG